MKTKISKYDASEYIKTREDMIAYLEVALEDGDPQLIVSVIGDIAKSKGMTQVAKESGLTRASLYKALTTTGDPKFSTVMKVVNSLGVKLKLSDAA